MTALVIFAALTLFYAPFVGMASWKTRSTVAFLLLPAVTTAASLSLFLGLNGFAQGADSITAAALLPLIFALPIPPVVCLAWWKALSNKKKMLATATIATKDTGADDTVPDTLSPLHIALEQRRHDTTQLTKNCELLHVWRRVASSGIDTKNTATVISAAAAAGLQKQHHGDAIGVSGGVSGGRTFYWKCESTGEVVLNDLELPIGARTEDGWELCRDDDGGENQCWWWSKGKSQSEWRGPWEADEGDLIKCKLKSEMVLKVLHEAEIAALNQAASLTTTAMGEHDEAFLIM